MIQWLLFQQQRPRLYSTARGPTTTISFLFHLDLEPYKPQPEKLKDVVAKIISWKWTQIQACNMNHQNPEAWVYLDTE